MKRRASHGFSRPEKKAKTGNLPLEDDSSDIETKESAELDALLKATKKSRKQVRAVTANDEGAVPRGVVYLGHIPYGFTEKAMRGFFSQFGTVTRCRLRVNKKGKSKHYGFVEFEDFVIAQIVADTMDKYMMFERVLECKVIPPEEVHPMMFKKQNIDRRRRRLAPEDQERAEQHYLRLKSLPAVDAEQNLKLKSLGIDYEWTTKVPALPGSPSGSSDEEDQMEEEIEEVPIKQTKQTPSPSKKSTPPKNKQEQISSETLETVQKISASRETGKMKKKGKK